MTNTLPWQTRMRICIILGFGVGFATQRQLLRINIATDKQKKEFRGACRDFLQAMVKKMKEKSPATYPLVRMMTSLDPRRISKEDKKKDNVKKFTGCLSIRWI